MADPDACANGKNTLRESESKPDGTQTKRTLRMDRSSPPLSHGHWHQLPSLLLAPSYTHNKLSSPFQADRPKALRDFNKCCRYITPQPIASWPQSPHGSSCSVTVPLPLRLVPATAASSGGGEGGSGGGQHLQGGRLRAVPYLLWPELQGHQEQRRWQKLSSYAVSFFEVRTVAVQLLGLLESFKGMTSDQITSQCLLKSYISGGIQLVRKTDMQQLTQFSAHFISNVEQQQACNFAAFVPLDERTPLQFVGFVYGCLKRAEWIKYLATFTNSEVRANSVYDAVRPEQLFNYDIFANNIRHLILEFEKKYVKENYMCLKKAAANLTSKFKPIVAWVVYNQGVWSFSKESFESEFVRDAGGENIDDTISENNYNVSDPDDMDNFHAILCTVDVVIDQTYVAQPEVYKLSTFLENMDVEDDSRFAFLTNQRVWRYDKRVYNSAVLDWFDGAISQPQLVLADLIEAFFPTGNYNTTYFRNIAKDEGVIAMDPELCDRNPSTPMDPVIVPCQ
ncbi:hypothetical protein ZIOFF_041700 [Zingiber officinale]|uniref:Uncharacterized protein n=1 Tax=Zingiber officinale TaxID=94328 RepID=A0A8J5G7Z3_ZINOF|nr:hypothetical protein ZIOFF_041700 [Zingiber officinale]